MFSRFHFRLLSLALLGAPLVLTACSQAQEPTKPRVAVFEPQTLFEGRFKMVPSEMDAIAQNLSAAGFAVERVSSAQIEDAANFNAEKFGALVIRGDAVPRQNFDELKKFTGEGGVLVALAANRPFLMAAAQKKDGGEWQHSPSEPLFAWETREITDLFGIRYFYKPGLFDNGTQHTASPVWKKYLTSARDWSGALPSNFIVPFEGGRVTPLLRSQRPDGRDVTPQIYIASKNGRHAVISSSEKWTKGDDNWQFGPQTVAAMTQIALDLKSGALKLDGAPNIEIPVDLPALEPLMRVAKGEVDPDGAPPLVRWGKFDGSGRELSETSPLPRVLAPGKSVSLPIPAFAGAAWLRVRAAIANSGAALKVERDDAPLWNETFSYIEAAGAGNAFAADLNGVPMEWTRRVFVPPTGKTAQITLSNPGKEPLYFDAVQLENAPAKPIKWIVGLNGGFNQIRFRGPYQLSDAQMKRWTSIRAGLWAYGVGAPGTPDRWKELDARMKRFAAFPAQLELIVEGTSAWNAASPERFARSKRGHTVAPNPEKWSEILRYVLDNYAQNIDRYEIWNEANSPQFFDGTTAQYAALWKKLVPMIRQSDPTAQIITSGLAGWKADFVDAMIENDILAQADLFGFHPYASKAPAWDVPFGETQGHLYARGQGIEIYNNEVGFTYKPGEWFVGDFNEKTQAELTNIALSRLLASGTAKVSLFHAGGDDHLYSLIDETGRPRAAYRVVEDYFALGQNGGTRLDVALTHRDGAPLEGVYTAAAQHTDGSISVVVNPSQSTKLAGQTAPAQAPKAPQKIGDEFDDKGKWYAFFGAAKWENGTVSLTPENGKVYVGLKGTSFTLNGAQTPIIELETTSQKGLVEVTLTLPDGTQKTVLKSRAAGTSRANWSEILGAQGASEIAVTIRAFGPATLDSLRFVGENGAAPQAAITTNARALPVVIQVPLSEKLVNPRAFWRVGENSGAVPLEVKKLGATRWAQIELPLEARGVLTVK